MSFALTTPQILARTKTVTRRTGWASLKRGDRLQAVEKGQGLTKGEQVVRLCVLEVLSVRRERLDSITLRDVAREGFPRMSRRAFLAFYCEGHPGCTPETVVTRIAFRYLSTDRVGVIPNAPKGRCRGCRKPVGKGRRTWCSAACVTDALIRKGDPATVRREVFGRDRGVCARCGLDTEQVARVLRYLNTQWHRWHRDGKPVSDEAHEAERWLFRTITGRTRGGAYTHLWEADHVVPVIEGGGGCGLDGYRTLCVRCHVGVTAALAARRARRRREAGLPLLSSGVSS